MTGGRPCHENRECGPTCEWNADRPAGYSSARRKGSRPWRPWESADPGRLRAIQAFKTVLAVVILIGLLHGAETETRIFGSIGGAFFLQCTSTGSRRRRQVTMALTAAATVAGVALGAGLAAEAWPRYVLLVAFAFAAFFCRRFLPDRGMFPVFGFVLTLLATAAPGPARAGGRLRPARPARSPPAFRSRSSSTSWSSPPTRPAAFADALRAFCRHAADYLGEQQAGLDCPPPTPSALERQSRRLRADLVAGQALADALSPPIPAGPPSTPCSSNSTRPPTV